MTNDKYILLPDHTVREEPDLIAWGQWFENRENRIVKQEQIGPYWVSTVFLGIDHNFSRLMGADEPPLLFETMVFHDSAPNSEIEMERCSTWEEAVAQHERIAAQFRAAVAN